MSVGATSDEILSQETLTRRNNFEPRYLSFRRDGIAILPTGTTLDARRGTILIDGQFLDNLPDGNIIQGQTSDGNSVSGTTSNSRILSSRDSAIADSQHAQVSTSRDASVSRSDYSSIENSRLCEIYSTSPVPVNQYCKILDSQQSYIRGDSGEITTSSIKDSFGSEIRNNVAGNVTGSWIDNCLYCEILNNRPTVVPRMKTITSSDSTVDSCAESVIVSSKDTEISRTVSGFRNVALACNNALLQDCSECIAYGLNTTGISIERSVLFGTTGVNSDEFRSGLDFHVDGPGNNITTNDGYAQTERGLVQNYAEYTLNEILQSNDGTVLLNSAPSITLFLPEAATLGADFPLGTSREFTVIGLRTATPSIIRTSAADTLENKPGWTQHYLRKSGGRTKVQLINSIAPYWAIIEDVVYNYQAYSSTLNNFGVAPPQVDASILPTSTNVGTHSALGADSYYTLEVITSDNPTVFSLYSPGMTLNVPGTYSLSYYIVVDNSSAPAGDFILRTDLSYYTPTSVEFSVPNSYIATGGRNAPGGSMTIQSPPVSLTVDAADVPVTIHIRISQDSTYTIASSANIVRVLLDVSASI